MTIYDNKLAETQAKAAIKQLGISGKRDTDEAMQTGRIAFFMGEDVLEAIKKDYKTLNSDRNFIRGADLSIDYRPERGETELEVEKVGAEVHLFEKY